MKKSYRVLVVDDYEIIRKIHIKNLEKIGIDSIDQSANGEEALGALEHNSYDLILLDWHMPVKNGIDTLKEIRSKEINTPVVMCTDEIEQESIDLATREGATDFIKKPYSPSVFKSIIKNILRIET